MTKVIYFSILNIIHKKYKKICAEFVNLYQLSNNSQKVILNIFQTCLCKLVIDAENDTAASQFIQGIK